MSILKSLGYDLIGGGYYGAEYMTKISKASASTLCYMYPLPKEGRELVLSATKIHQFFAAELTIQNISGCYYLASSQIPIKNWPETFNVTIFE